MWARFLHRIVPLEWFGVGTPSTPTPNCIITRCLTGVARAHGRARPWRGHFVVILVLFQPDNTNNHD